jgi:hypothetical protein
VRWRDWLGLARGEPQDVDDLAPGEGISLRATEAIEVGEVCDISKLFAALASALPVGAVLYAEGTNIAPDVQEFLGSESVEPAARVTQGTSWPESQQFHVPATPANLMRMHELSLRHAEPEVCDHLVVYRDEDVLISAYDAGFGTVYARRDLPKAALDRLREAAGG